MRVTTYGTRGSIPICRQDSSEFGGNTTCLRVESACLPSGTWLAIDAGSGFVPFCSDAEKSGMTQLLLFLTHYHHDHTMGLPLGGVTYRQDIPIRVYGPWQNNCGPQDVLENIMRPPYFPMAFPKVAAHFFFQKFDYPELKVIVIHPKGGVKVIGIQDLERLEKRGDPLLFKDKMTFSLGECLVVRMHQSEHPQQTISYRFEERPTGKVFCFLTDHENQDGFPTSLKMHLKNADLLIADAQYTPAEYQSGKAGFGHATPLYVVNLANAVGASRLGFTHHDPQSDDAKIAAILRVAREHAALGGFSLDLTVAKSIDPDQVFACHDYDVYEV